MMKDSITESTYKGMFNLNMAPVLYPTEDEFAEPWTYIKKISGILSETGIVVIEPPPCWNAGFYDKMTNGDMFTFETKAQRIDMLKNRSGNLQFYNDIKKIFKEKGREFKSPIVDGKELDLYKLNVEVFKRGGIGKIQKDMWKDIARELRLSPKKASPSTVLSKHYYNYVSPLLANQKKRKRENTETNVKRRRISDKPLWKKLSQSNFNSHEDGYDEQEELSDDDQHYGYDEGKTFSLNNFKNYAKNFEEHFFAWDKADGKKTIDPLQKEKEYWKIVDSGEERVLVYYGSDLDVKKYKSGFPDKSILNNSDESLKKYSYVANSNWNLNNLSNSTFLHHLGESVAGITRPMMYVGMLFSSFCWHTEDNFLYSTNYVHSGSQKRWYCVPPNAAEKFEQVMNQHLPNLFDKSPNLLHQLVTMLSPSVLVENGVPVYTALQKAGQFIITYPRSYHAGFNMGFNVAESVNFAIEDWLPFCRLAVNNYRFHRPSSFSYEEFVLKACKNPDNIYITKMLHKELYDIITQEQDHQNNLLMQGYTQTYPEYNSYQCDLCGYDCCISSVTCTNHPNKRSCILHSKDICQCSSSHKIISLKYNISNLKEILNNLEKLGEINSVIK